MKNIVETLILYKEFIGIIISFFTVAIPFASFFISKNKEQKQINFNKFHKDLMVILSNNNPEGHIGLIQQVAIIYEFRNYPEYYPVINRVLEFEIKRWKDEVKKNKNLTILIKEAEETIYYINQNFIIRHLTKSI